MRDEVVAAVESVRAKAVGCGSSEDSPLLLSAIMFS
jgi:hypothetical protein